MKPLFEDQIHNGPFIALCDMIWSDDVSRTEKSGVWDYYQSISKEFNIPLVDHTNVPQSGVVFVGMCHLIENIFQSLPRNGNYIIIHRTNDRQYLPEFDAVKPPSVKHVYTVDCKGVFSNVTAIPFGLSSINGEDNILKEVIKGYDGEDEWRAMNNRKIFACYNVNADTVHRNKSLPFIENNPLVNYVKPPIGQYEFHHACMSHDFVMALAGCGADASRQWSSIILGEKRREEFGYVGSIPIVTDCEQMRHFADLPIVFCPENFEDITEEWLDEQKEKMQYRSTLRMRMSYWINHVQEKRKEFEI